jgi:hypothetical protein
MSLWNFLGHNPVWNAEPCYYIFRFHSHLSILNSFSDFGILYISPPLWIPQVPTLESSIYMPYSHQRAKVDL